jgi:hypothetical protein
MKRELSCLVEFAATGEALNMVGWINDVKRGHPTLEFDVSKGGARRLGVGHLIVPFSPAGR